MGLSISRHRVRNFACTANEGREYEQKDSSTLMLTPMLPITDSRLMHLWSCRIEFKLHALRMECMMKRGATKTDSMVRNANYGSHVISMPRQNENAVLITAYGGIRHLTHCRWHYLALKRVINKFDHTQEIRVRVRAWNNEAIATQYLCQKLESRSRRLLLACIAAASIPCEQFRPGVWCSFITSHLRVCPNHLKCNYFIYVKFSFKWREMDIGPRHTQQTLFSSRFLAFHVN